MRTLSATALAQVTRRGLVLAAAHMRLKKFVQRASLFHLAIEPAFWLRLLTTRSFNGLALSGKARS